MKRLLFFLLAWIFFTGIAFSATRITVTKNSDGEMSGVTRYLTLSGQTVFEIDDTTGGITIWADALKLSGATVSVIGLTPTVGNYAIYNSTSSITGSPTLDATVLTGEIPASSMPDFFASGASPAVGVPDSGNSLEQKYFGTVVTHEVTTSTVYGLPLISGTSCVYVKFLEGAEGGGITVYTADVQAQPFYGNGLSGASYMWLPQFNPYESMTVYSVQLSGTCKYWFVEATSSWVAGP